jgi:ABC-type nitrate/sulfonate/bicarbonate transport system substrate-binding protein
LFKKHGIEPQIVIMPGAAVGISTLMAGDVDFLSAGGSVVISANLKGADIVMFGAYINKGVQSIMARSDLKRPADLKGKTVGITRLYDGGHRLLERALEIWKLNAADVKLLALGSSPAMLARLEKGGIDAAVLQDPTFFMAEDIGFKTLGDPVAMDIQYLQNVLVALRGYVKTHRDLASRFMKGFVEGVAHFKRNKEDSLKILMKKMRIEKGKEAYLERSYGLYATQYIESAPYPSVAGTRTVLEFMAKDFPKAKTADPNSFIDNSLIKPLEDSGFIKALYQ